MIIRKAETVDIPHILELLREVLFVHHKGRPDIFKSGCTKYTEEELCSIIKNPLTPVFVAVKDSKVVGHSFCKFIRYSGDNVLTDIKTLYIDDICILEDYRGLHIGKELYLYVYNFAKENSCYNITLNVWACNTGAISFYEAMGMDVQKLTMEKIL